MPEPITLATLAVNIGCGIAGNAMQAGGVGGYRKIAKILASGTPTENHDILRATHTAYVAAMRVMAQSAKQVAATPVEKEAARELKRLCGDRVFHDFRSDGEHFPLAEVNVAIDDMFSRGRDEPGGDSRDADTLFSELVVRDLALWGVNLPQVLVSLFLEGVDGHQPWHVVFRATFAEQVTSNQAAFRILTFERLGELRSAGLVLIDEVEHLHATLDRVVQTTAETNLMVSALTSSLGEDLKAARATMEQRVQERSSELAAARQENERLGQENRRLSVRLAELEAVVLSIKSITRSVTEGD